jgi:Fe-S cluster assembly iron-binding protein IscA
MKIIFDEKVKKALEELIENSSENYVRIKPFLGCGRPAYELYADFKTEDDILEIIDDIPFIVKNGDERVCDKIEIKYDKEVYNNGFYIRGI